MTTDDEPQQAIDLANKILHKLKNLSPQQRRRVLDWAHALNNWAHALNNPRFK